MLTYYTTLKILRCTPETNVILCQPYSNKTIKKDYDSTKYYTTINRLLGGSVG